MVVSALHSVLQEKLSYSSWIMVVRERGKCYYNLATICKNAFFSFYFSLHVKFGGRGEEREKRKTRSLKSQFYFIIIIILQLGNQRSVTFGAPYTTIVRWQTDIYSLRYSQQKLASDHGNSLELQFSWFSQPYNHTWQLTLSNSSSTYTARTESQLVLQYYHYLSAGQ